MTIDLNGFSLAAPGATGIFLDFGVSSCAIRNGTIQGWTSTGISAASATSLVVEDIHVADNTFAVDCVARAAPSQLRQAHAHRLERDRSVTL